jgi:hypothetical protein
LLAAKIRQAHYANKSRRPDETFAIGDKVMLSTLHRRREYTQGKSNCVAKFLPCYDGPYNIIDSFPDFSAYKLELPNSPNVFPTFHASQLKRHVANDPTLFPSCKHACPGPILTPDGLEEYHIEKIIDQHCLDWVGNTSSDGPATVQKKIDGSLVAISRTV